MKIANNLLRPYLRNVYFFCGTVCGGKTTLSKAFAEKHQMQHLEEMALFEKFDELAEQDNQPVYFSQPQTWEEYFNRPYKEYAHWQEDLLMEQLPLAFLELIRLSATAPVAADITISPKKILELVNPDRIVFLVTTPEIVVKHYYDRPGPREIYETIMGLDNPQKTLENTNKALAYRTQLYLEELEESGVHYLVRNDNRSIEETLVLIDRHFGIV